MSDGDGISVIYSFPHQIGHGGISSIAWHQVMGVAAAGAEVTVFPYAVRRRLPSSTRVEPTLARGTMRLPYSVLGHRRTFALHDQIVARRLMRLRRSADVVHAWPLAARHTLKAAARLGIPTVLERPNSHTRFAYEVVKRESDRLGVPLRAGDEHVYDARLLRIEEEEYRLANRLLCPSDFVVRTFLDEGFPADKLVRHQYGFDEHVFHADARPSDVCRPLVLLFVGRAALRKGLHYAINAWLRSPASKTGSFFVAGADLPAYRKEIFSMLAHPSVHILGHRDDVAALMRKSDALVLPTIEEGSPLAVLEALGSGCVPLVSEVCAGVCRHGHNALVHRVGDVDQLTNHITLLHEDRRRLAGLRTAALKTAASYTWTAAGIRLLRIYREVAAATKPIASTS